jgi:hypothetical protein
MVAVTTKRTTCDASACVEQDHQEKLVLPKNRPFYMIYQDYLSEH